MIAIYDHHHNHGDLSDSVDNDDEWKGKNINIKI